MTGSSKRAKGKKQGRTKVKGAAATKTLCFACLAWLLSWGRFLEGVRQVQVVGPCEGMSREPQQQQSQGQSSLKPAWVGQKQHKGKQQQVKAKRQQDSKAQGAKVLPLGAQGVPLMRRGAWRSYEVNTTGWPRCLGQGPQCARPWLKRSKRLQPKWNRGGRQEHQGGV